MKWKVLVLVVSLSFFLFGFRTPAFASPEESLKQRIENLEKIIQGQQKSLESLKLEMERQKEAEDKARQEQERLKALERKVEEVEKVTTKREEELKKEKKTGLIAYWRDGFFLETPDKQFRLQFGGVLHFDTRFFSGGSRSPDSFDIRRARYDMRGNLYRGDLEHIFRLQIEMADDPYLRNAYWMFKVRPEFNLQIGQFKVPAGGADSLTEEAHINFVEYATATPVSPFFDRGINIQSQFLGGKVQTCLAATTGVGVDKDVGSGDYDNHKDFAGRILLVPFKDMASPWLKGMRFAGSYQTGIQSIKTTRGETNMRTENYESRWFRWTKSYVDLDQRTRYGGEFHWLHGPLTMSYEFNRVQWEDITVYKEDDKGTLDFRLPGNYHVDVHQFWVSYFLTGEQKEFEDVFFAWRQPKPKKNFSLKNGTWGAWEVIARYSYKDASQELFDSGLLDGSSEGYSVTGGIRWIWNPKCRIMFDVNYLHSSEGKGIITEYADRGVFTNRKYESSELGYLLRFILTP
ncbi:MAG: porin [Syntrophales bacterium]|nr:porin [Syntrophales bacterium]